MTADTPSPSEVDYIAGLVAPVSVDEAAVETVARAIARATVTAAEPEKCGRLSEAAIQGLIENLAMKFYPEARAAIAALPSATVGWQPIETAPKDGRLILLATGGWVGEGRYFNDACRWFEMNADPSDAWDGEIYQPTHWRPLPEPPSITGDER